MLRLGLSLQWAIQVTRQSVAGALRAVPQGPLALERRLGRPVLKANKPTNKNTFPPSGCAVGLNAGKSTSAEELLLRDFRGPSLSFPVGLVGITAPPHLLRQEEIRAGKAPWKLVSGSQEGEREAPGGSPPPSPGPRTPLPRAVPARASMATLEIQTTLEIK